MKNKVEKNNNLIFTDPTRKRLYVLAVIAVAAALVYLFFRMFYPQLIFVARYAAMAHRFAFVWYINRIFAVLIGLNFVKLFVWMLLARRSRAAPAMDTGILVTAIIPAYNEEKVIAKTLESVLASDYKNLEVIVVDDGSGDATAEIVEKQLCGGARVRLIRQKNSGKAAALNAGIARANGTILILLDADTRIAPNAISMLLPHFSGKRVAAVSGNTKVGNASNIITRCQKVEYLRDFNLIKNGMSRMNCMSVVPGALGAWRKSAIAEVGGFSLQTLGEDRDLTMALLKAGYKITFEPLAFSSTEAPSSCKDFMKQRFRWTYATMQCIRKYIGCVFSLKAPAMGFILLPELIIFQILVPVVTVIGLISNLLYFNKYECILLAVTFLAALLFDILTFLFALRITKEKLRPADLLFVVPQKLIYGIFCTYLLYKSLIIAFIGSPTGWNKVNRTGKITNPGAFKISNTMKEVLK